VGCQVDDHAFARLRLNPKFSLHQSQAFFHTDKLQARIPVYLGRIKSCSRTLDSEGDALIASHKPDLYLPNLPCRATFLKLSYTILTKQTWSSGLPVTNEQFYQRLKKRGVLVVPGHYFFPGLKEDWPHKKGCIRVNYSQDDQTFAAGMKIIAEEVKRAYATA
jgi:predicted methyltransferase